MRGYFRSFLAASAVMILAALPTARASERDYMAAPVEWRPPRSRFPGRHKPAGTKLARKAQFGTVGRATLR